MSQIKKKAKSGVNSKHKIELHKNDLITMLTQIEIVTRRNGIRTETVDIEKKPLNSSVKQNG